VLVPEASEATSYMKLTCSAEASPEEGVEHTLHTHDWFKRDLVFLKHLDWNLAWALWCLCVCEHAFQNVEGYAKVVHYHLYINKWLFTYDFLWLQLY